jgi:TPR repeat protein
MWRNEGKPRRALSWFKRAAKMGDDEANLEIAKHYLENENSPRRALPYLRRVVNSIWVTEAGTEEATILLRRLGKSLKAGGTP